MTAFAISTGGLEYYDQKTGASVNATLDTYTISAGSTLIVRTDTYSCVNHTVAAGSLDNVAFSGIGGVLQFDPTYTRQISYTGGSGNAPAYGTTISQGGVSGVFQGTWADWQSEPTVAGAAIPASGYMKLGGITGGNFSAGALIGITATCSGADIQSWIEIRGAQTATITIPRIGTWTGPASTIWFEIGTTNGSAGQVISCPTTATCAGAFTAVWVETSAGSGVYEYYWGVGSQVANAVNRTDTSMKCFWQTTSGIRFGNNGTNNVGYVPATGCKVRIPAVILTNCARSVSGSGPRVVPHATLDTRQEISTSFGGNVDIKGFACQWYSSFYYAFLLRAIDCSFATNVIIFQAASPLDIQNCVSAPVQAQVGTGFFIRDQLAGGNLLNCGAMSFSTPYSGFSAISVQYSRDVTLTGCKSGFVTEKDSSYSSAVSSSASVNTRIIDHTCLGGIIYYLNGGSGAYVKNTIFYANLITTTSTQYNGAEMGIYFVNQSGSPTVDGFTIPLVTCQPWNAIVNSIATSGIRIRNIGSYASRVNLNNICSGIYSSEEACSDVKIQRCYVSNTRVGPFYLQNTDSGITLENVYGDYADTVIIKTADARVKNCGLVATTGAWDAVYGTHFHLGFTSTTAGHCAITCNEPTAASAPQCYVTSGSPKFNSSGYLLLTSVGQQVVWEMDFFAIGYTAFTNTLPAITGANATSAGNGVWGNHTLTFQVNTGSGYGGTWLTLTAANLIAQTFSPTTGFKIKIRATCSTASTTNSLRVISVALTTTDAAQGDNMYPLDVNTLTLTGLVTGSDVVILQAGTTTILTSTDANVGTTYAYTYETLQSVDIGIFKAGYQVKYIRAYSLTAADASLPIEQALDANYA